MRKLSITLFVLCLASVSAYAATISGTVEYNFPNLGDLYPNDGGPVAFTVPPQTVITLNSDIGFPFVQNTISDISICIEFLYSAGWTSASFNGEVFKFSDFDINGINVNQSMGADITYDTHAIYVNWQGLPFTQGESFVNIAYNPSNAVPEPTSLLLLATGLGALGLAAWRRKK
jgi:hypothetical protein